MVQRAALFTGRGALPPRFRHIHWHSEALGRRMAFLLGFPAGYADAPARRYPVLYLLHGSGHDCHSVLREVHPQEHRGELGPALLVIPDGEQGWWLDSPLVPRSRFGEYLLELVRLVDHDYPTVADRRARGLCGFSMGGYGAMLLAGQHPELFGAASSLLGPLDIARMFPDYHRLRMLLGPDLSIWQQYNPCQTVDRLRSVALWFRTAEEAFDRPQNDAFASALRTRQIDFDYQVLPGGHDTLFVRQHIGACFAFHRQLDATL